MTKRKNSKYSDGRRSCSYKFPSLVKEGQGWLDPVLQKLIINYSTSAILIIPSAPLRILQEQLQEYFLVCDGGTLISKIAQVAVGRVAEMFVAQA